ncbi:hypothetical protein TSOC_012223, partial [Tetrabaena socialis]
MSKFMDKRGNSQISLWCSGVSGAIVAVTILTAYSVLTSSGSRQRVACLPTASGVAEEQHNRVAAQYVSLSTVLVGLKSQAKAGAAPSALVIKELNYTALRIPPTTI